MDLLIAANTVTQPNSDLAPATGTPGWATDGDPTTNTLATQAPAWHYNMMMAEMLAIVKAAGITPSNADWSQVLKAMQTIFAPAQRGVAPYSATLAQLIGGYPKYAVVVDAGGNFWCSTADKNMTTPTDDGALWVSFAESSLGFAPVQQGGGAGQGPNKIYLGWGKDALGLKCQVDTTDQGYFSFRGETQMFHFEQSVTNTNSISTSFSFLPLYNGYLKIDFTCGGGASGNFSEQNYYTENCTVLGGGVNWGNTTLGAGTIYLEVTANKQASITIHLAYSSNTSTINFVAVATYIPK